MSGQEPGPGRAPGPRESGSPSSARPGDSQLFSFSTLLAAVREYALPTQATGENLVMLLGVTGVGKTAMALFLHGIKMGIKIVTKESFIGSDVIRNDVEVVDAVDEAAVPQNFVVGHSQDSETKQMHALPAIAPYNLSIQDAPGAKDSTGPLADAVHGIVLAATMRASANCRFVLLVDYRALETVGST